MKKCEKCNVNTIEDRLFICKGRMVCEGCYMTITENNTLFFDESKFERKNILECD